MKDSVTGGADFRFDWHPLKRVARKARATEPAKTFMLEREPEDGPDLEVRLVSGSRNLREGGESGPSGAVADGDVWAGEKFSRLGFRPIGKRDFVDKLHAEEQAWTDFVA